MRIRSEQPMPTTLITTFQTWLPHQVSNSSDDLVAHLLAIDRVPPDCHLLRHVPVDFHVAPRQVLAKIAELQPQRVVCCGMAETRLTLSVESNGVFQSDRRFTSVDLLHLLQPTTDTVISHDAGRFVCNYLYYQVLRHLQGQVRLIPAIFVHVPLFTGDNADPITNDFLALLR
jgi:pyroglutamyl-peptidase